ncbi:MAG TPA: amidohydrolase [Candidatus Binatia bacterium]|nr:amidohydrolase [Candidatus Binatia bacterium]
MKRFFFSIFSLLVLAACIGHEQDFVRSLSAPSFADWILLNGKIITLDKNSSIAEAVAVRDGTIVAVGSDGEMRRWRGPRTTEVNLAGRAVIPGLNDSHIHATAAGLSWDGELHWENLRSLAQGMNQIAVAAKQKPPGTWIVVAGGWMPSQFVEKRLPTRADLDAAAPRHPVYIQILGHAALLNSAALKAVAVSRDSRDPPGGRFERDAKTGELTGYSLGSGAWKYVYDKIPRPPFDKARESLRSCFRELNRLGITSVGDLHTDDVTFAHRRLLNDMARAGDLSLRVNFYLAPEQTADQLETFSRGVAEIKQPKQTEMFRFAGFAEVAAPENSDQLATPAKYKALGAPEKEIISRAMRFFAAGGHNFQIHGGRDSRARELLDTIEAVHRETTLSRLRIGFTHLEDASPEIIQRIRKLGAGIAVQSRLAVLGESIAHVWREETILNAPPLRTILDVEVPLGAGSGAFRSANYSPMLALWWLVTGKSITGTPMRDPKQNLTRIEALRAFTLGSAWFTADENRKGSIEAGKFADLVVLNGDYLNVPVDGIPALESLLTMVGGRVVYAAGPFARFEKSHL